MEKEVKLVKKVKRLLKCLGCPRWLHHFGPKTYEFYEHLIALIVREYCRLSYRRVSYLLDLFGFACPSKSALQYTSNKIPKWMWDAALLATSGVRHYLVALDSTGFSRTNPSYHYLRRIDGKMPNIHVKLSAAFDTRKKKFCAAKIRVLPRHDSKDARYLVAKSDPKIVVADKAYNSEWLYSYSYDKDILFMSPKKKNAKQGYYRKKLQKQFKTRTYNRRQLVESGFGGMKRTEGSSVSSKKAKTIRAEIYCKMVTYNLFYCLFRLLGQSLYNGKLNEEGNIDLTFFLGEIQSKNPIIAKLIIGSYEAKSEFMDHKDKYTNIAVASALAGIIVYKSIEKQVGFNLTSQGN